MKTLPRTPFRPSDVVEYVPNGAHAVVEGVAFGRGIHIKFEDGTTLHASEYELRHLTEIAGAPAITEPQGSSSLLNLAGSSDPVFFEDEVTAWTV